LNNTHTSGGRAAVRRGGGRLCRGMAAF